MKALVQMQALALAQLPGLKAKTRQLTPSELMAPPAQLRVTMDELG